MKRNFFLLLLLAFAAGPAAAAESVEWDDNRPEFKFFSEKKDFTREGWEKLPPAEQGDALRNVKDAALQRQEEVARLYSSAAGVWNLQQAKYFTDRYDGAELKAVYVWIGAQQGHALTHKVATVREMVDKAAVQGLNDADAARAAPYLQPQAITELRSLKAAEALRQQAGGQFKKHELPKKTVDATIKGVSGALSGNVERNMAKIFDNDLSAGSAGAASPGGKYAVPKTAMNGAVSGIASQTGAFVADKTAAALGAPRATSASTVKSAAPAALDEAGKAKSTAWTSDAYGITVETAQGKKSYRSHQDAEAAIRQMPAESVKKITLYGHGSPGMQTVGPGQYDALYTAELLDGKMAKNGVIQFSGCNTASIGDSTLNPAVGLSMVARRLLYFSLPYWQDRADGVPAAQAKQQWEKEWNADLSHDTSTLVKGAIVCGYRTFGLVPGRLPGLTKLLGNQEATEPGYVAGKKVCYQNGKEVPAP